MSKFTLDEDYTGPVSICIDQVDARFVDETMRGSYEYPAIKLMLTKLSTKTDSKTQEVIGTKQIFIDGNWDADTHVSLPLTKGLKKGEYLLVYSGEFTELNPEQKLVVSVYMGKRVDLQKVTTEDYPEDSYNQLVQCLVEVE